MDAFSAAKWLGVTVVVPGVRATTGWAQAPTAATNVGPGRIIRRNATSCELDIAIPASLKYRIDPAALATADQDRLIKRWATKGTPCVATVTGTETSAGVKADSIKFYTDGSKLKLLLFNKLPCG
jgi:hypothetical protein